MATMGNRPPKYWKHAKPSVPLGMEDAGMIRTPTDVARELRTKLYTAIDQWARGGSGPQLEAILPIIEAAIARDRQKQAALVLRIVQNKVAEWRRKGYAPPPEVEQWLAQADQE